MKRLYSVIPAPYPVVGSNRQVRGKLQRESTLFRYLKILSVSSRNDWIPVPRLRTSRTSFTGMTTFYEFSNLLFLSSMEARRLEGGASRARSGERKASQGNFILVVPLDPPYPARAGRGTCRSGKLIIFLASFAFATSLPNSPAILTTLATNSALLLARTPFE